MNQGSIKIRLMRGVAIGVATFVLQGAVLSVGAQQDTIDKGLQNYITYALEHNPRIKSVLDDINVKKLEAKLAFSLPDPMIMVKASAGENRSITAIGASQMIMWPGKLLSMRKAGYYITEARQHTLAATFASIEADVRSSYAQLYALGQTIQRQKENIELLRQFEQIARTNYINSGIPRTSAFSNGTSTSSSGSSSLSNSTGSAAGGMGQMGQSSSSRQMSSSSMSSGSMPSVSTNQSALLKIQIEQAMLEDQIRSAEIQAESQWNRFRAILGGDQAHSIALPSEIVPLPLPGSQKDIIEAVREKSPQIIAMEREIASAAVMESVARKSLFPDISLGVEYMPSLPSGSSMEEPTMNESNGTWDASVSLSIPLWFGKKKNEIDRVKSMKSGMVNELADMKNMVVAETEMLLNTIQNAERRIELYRDMLVPQSKQVIGIVLAGYSTGQSTFLDIIDAQRTVLDLQTTLANEQAGREIAVAEIVRILGSKQLESIKSKE